MEKEINIRKQAVAQTTSMQCKSKFVKIFILYMHI